MVRFNDDCTAVRQGTESVGVDLTVNEEQLRNKLTAHSPTADIVIGGVKVSCILDTGAETSLISCEFYKEHLADKVNSLGTVGTFIRLVGANDLEIPVAGYLETPIEIFGSTVTASFLVRSESSPETSSGRRTQYPILLGCNVLRAIASLGVVPIESCTDEWNVALQWFKFKNWQDECLHGSSPPTPGVVGDVCLVQEETIPPFSARYVSVSCNLNEPDQHNQCVLIRNLASSCSVQVLEGVQKVRNSLLNILLCNLGDSPVTMLKSQSIASAITAIEVEEVHIQPHDSHDGLQVSVGLVVCNEIETIGDDTSTVPTCTDTPNQLREFFVFPDGVEYTLPPGISLRGLDPEHAILVAEMIKKYESAFSMGPLDLGKCTLIPHGIHLTSDQPVRLPYRRIPPHCMSEVQKLLQGLLEKGIIHRSSSPYASPTVLVRKKDGSIRLCIDYRKLNALTQKDAFPLPRIEETLEALGGSQFFSSLDMAHGYFQLVMHPDSVDKTAFRVPWGLFSFDRMPQGLCNSPSTFQRTVEMIFGDMNMSKLILYLDDILVFSNTFQEHIERLGVVFERLIKHGLKLKGGKCGFFQREKQGTLSGSCGLMMLMRRFVSSKTYCVRLRC